MIPIKEGYVRFKGFKTYYKIAGKQTDKTKIPVLVLAGGPGSAHYYLLDLQQLAKSGREVIFYDQLGSGQSDHPDDESLWNIKTFTDEIDAVRKTLGLKNIHLVGHSWGGMLAIEYLMTKPSCVSSVVLSSAMISMPLFIEEMAKLRKDLPGNTNKILTAHEQAGTTDSPEYQAAYQVFNKKHMFRGDERPAHIATKPEYFGKTVYETMWGLSETYPNGTLAKWDRTKDLHKINIPTLITSGRYDELTPKQANLTKELIPGSKQVIFEYSGHLPHIEEPNTFASTLESFFEDVEKS